MELTKESLEAYMRRAIIAAKKSQRGIRKPYIGALVIVESGEIAGEGYKDFIGTTNFVVHAERMALDIAKESAKGGYLITTLEPCTQAKPNQILKPCSELIVERGIQAVVIGLVDASSKYPQNGIGYLREHGVRVIRYTKLNDEIIKELMPKKYALKRL